MFRIRMIIWTLAIASLPVSGQHLIATGGQSAGEGLYLASSIGEPITGTLSNESFTLTMGFLQPFSSASSVAPVITVSGFRVYPNPVSDVVIVESVDPECQTLFYHLVSVTGREILSGQVEHLQDQFRLPVQGVEDGFYLLVIWSGIDNAMFRTGLVIKK